jgi:hypothetical protein
MGFSKVDTSSTSQVTAQQKTKVLTYSFDSPPSLFELTEMVRDALGEFAGTPLTTCSDGAGNPLKITVAAVEQAVS